MSKKFHFAVRAEDVYLFLKLCKSLGMAPSHVAALALNSYVAQLQKIADMVGIQVNEDE